MNAPAVIGHNNPPDPIEVIQSAYDAVFSEVANWLDGSPVENEGQMREVDKLLASVKEAESFPSLSLSNPRSAVLALLNSSADTVPS